MSKQYSTLFRILGAIMGISISVSLFSYLRDLALDFGVLNESVIPIIYLALVLLGAILGAVLLVQGLQKAQLALSSMSREQLASTLFGAIMGLIAGALVAVPARALPQPFNFIAPLVGMVSSVYLFTTALNKRPNDVYEWFMQLGSGRVETASVPSIVSEENQERLNSTTLLDTSVIIDGRIADISKTGFLNTILTVPHFVLTELQFIADSPDPIRRKRGRRGLEVLDVLRNECPLPFEITDMDVSEVREVDSKLVALGRHLSAPIMTNDYNLNRVASLQGVTVLNINDLANSVKAAFLPGEELNVKVIQEGREAGQGVAYLEDGTMVVVEEGKYHLNEQMDVVVTKVLQTSAGRMIFARTP